MSGSLVLTLDGSTRVCTAALLGPSRRAPSGARPAPAALEVLASRSEVDSRGQAKVLLRMVDDMLSETGFVPADLGAIVVGVGPGTFTGVRIAVATARALSLALSAPVAGVSTLAALAAGAVDLVAVTRAAGSVQPVLVPVVDARRGQLFYGVYERPAGAEGWTRSGPYGVCDRDALGDALPGGSGRGEGVSAVPSASPVVVVAESRDLLGELPDGVGFLHSEVCAHRLVLGQEELVEPGDKPQGNRIASWIADAAAGKVQAVPELVKPIYVRSPDADIHITKMKDPWADSPKAPDARGGR